MMKRKLNRLPRHIIIWNKCRGAKKEWLKERCTEIERMTNKRTKRIIKMLVNRRPKI